MNAWIFQGNPKRFDINLYLHEHFKKDKQIAWTVPEAFVARVQPRDRAFMWRADGKVPKSGGLVAVGRTLGRPELLTGTAAQLWVKPEEDATEERLAENERLSSEAVWRVRINLEELRLTESAGMVARVDLEDDAALSRLRILRMRAVTVSEVTDQQARDLLDRWKVRTRK